MHPRKSHRADALRQTCARAFGAAFLCSLIAADCDGKDAPKAEGHTGGTSGNGGGNPTGGATASGGSSARGGTGGAAGSSGGTVGGSPTGGGAGDAPGGEGSGGDGTVSPVPEWMARCAMPNALGASCEMPAGHPYCVQGRNLTTNDCGQQEIRQGGLCDLEEAIAVCSRADWLRVYYRGEGSTSLATERASCSSSTWCRRPYADGGLPPDFFSCVLPPDVLWQQINCVCVSDGISRMDGICSTACSSDRDCLHPTVEMTCLTECADEELENLVGWCIPPSLKEQLAARCGQ